HECAKVKCPKFQVCVVNMQGLPLCKCPSEFLCRSNRKRAICGTDGITYESKCHMRIASCKQSMMVRKKHRGVCTAADKRDGETFKRKMRRRMRRRRRRRQKLEETASAGQGVDGGGSEIEEGGGGTEGDTLTSFRRGGDIFGNQNRRGRLGPRTDETSTHGGKGDKRKDKRARLKRRRRRKKNRKQRKQRKGSKKVKNERRRRRRKRQHGKPRSRSKRHRHANNYDDAEVRARLFEEEFGQSTWFA
ncbi:agrin, partial [Elysia marginata]